MKVIIPENLKEITYSQYLNFLKVTKGQEDDTFLKLSMITIFCNVTIESVKKWSIEDFENTATHLMKVLQQKPNFIQRVIVGKKEFGFIPNLDQMTAGEYGEIDTYLANEETHINALGVLFRPIINKSKELYSIEPYEGSEKHIDYIKQLPLEAALGAFVFFWTLNSDLLKATIASLQLPTQENLTLAEDLEKGGVGINHSIQLLEKAYSISMQLQNYRYTSL